MVEMERSKGAEELSAALARAQTEARSISESAAREAQNKQDQHQGELARVRGELESELKEIRKKLDEANAKEKAQSDTARVLREKLTALEVSLTQERERAKVEQQQGDAKEVEARQEMARREARIAELEKIEQALQTRLADSDRQREALVDEAAGLRARAETLEKQLAEVRAYAEKLKNDVASQAKRCEEAEGKSRRLEQEVLEALRANEQAQDAARRASGESAQRERTIAGLEAALASLTSEHNAAGEELREQTAAAKQHADAAAEMESQLNELMAALERESDRTRATEQTLAETHAAAKSLEQRVGELQQKLDLERVRAEEAMKHATAAERERFDQKLHAMQERVSTLESDLTRERQASINARTMSLSAQEQHESVRHALEKRCAEQEASLVALQREADQSRAECAALKSQAETLGKEHEALRARAEHAAAEMEAASKALHDELASAQEESRVLAEQIGSLETTVAAERQEAARRLGSMEADLSQLRASLEGELRRAEALSNELAAANARGEQIPSLERDLTASMEHAEELEGELKELRAGLDAARTEAESVRAREAAVAQEHARLKSALESRIADLTKELERHAEAIRQAKQQSQGVESEAQAARAEIQKRTERFESHALQMQAQLDAAARERDALSARLVEAARIAESEASLRERVQLLEAGVSELQAELTNSQTALEHERERVRQLDEARSLIATDESARSHELEARLMEMEAALDKERAEAIHAGHRTKQEMSDLRSQLEHKLAADLDRHRTEIAERLHIQHQREMQEALRGEHARHEAELAQIRSQAGKSAELESALAELKKQHQSDLEQFRAELGRRQQQDQSQAHAEALRAAEARHAEQLEHLRAEIGEHQRVHAGALADAVRQAEQKHAQEVERLRQEITKLVPKDAYAALEAAVRDADAKHERELERQREELSAQWQLQLIELEDAREQLTQQLESERAAHAAALQANESAAANGGGALAEAGRRAAELDASIGTLREKLREESQQRATVQKHAADLELKLGQLRTHAKELESRLLAQAASPGRAGHVDHRTMAFLNQPRHLETRRRRLALAHQLLREQSGKLRKANEAIKRRFEQCEQILRQRADLVAARERIIEGERRIQKQNTRSKVAVILLCGTGVFGILGGLSWGLAQHLAPATFVGTAIISADGRGRDLNPAELNEWQKYHENLLSDPRFHQMAAERFSRLGVQPLAGASDVQKLVENEIKTEVVTPGQMMIHMQGKGSSRTERILNTLVGSFVSHANAAQMQRTDGAVTKTFDQTRIGREPLDNTRTYWALAFLGGGLVVVTAAAVVLWKKLSGARTKFERDTALAAVLDESRWGTPEMPGGGKGD
jgi:chromosome segregation ATPase